jgi:N-acetylneuraminate synthase
VLSTGASTLGEIDIAVEAIRRAGCNDIALLHCILNYPTSNQNAHLRMIEGLKRAYPEYIIGYSDHTLPDNAMTPLVAAYLLGAVILEKHFTHDKTLPGNDHYHAMDVNDLSRFVEIADTINILLGPSEHKAPILFEELSRKNARRSIVIAQDLPAGHILTDIDITYKRPGTGISPMHWDSIIGKKLLIACEGDHILRWQDVAMDV